jgi:hypothetical protein
VGFVFGLNEEDVLVSVVDDKLVYVHLLVD